MRVSWVEEGVRELRILLFVDAMKCMPLVKKVGLIKMNTSQQQIFQHFLTNIQFESRSFKLDFNHLNSKL